MTFQSKSIIGALTLIGASCNITDNLLNVKTQAALKTVAGVTLGAAAAIGAFVLLTDQR